MPQLRGVSKPSRDPLLDEAAVWLLRIRSTPDDASLQAELNAWLGLSERHAAAWNAAQQVWSLSGEIGPAPRKIHRPALRLASKAAAIALAASLVLAVAPTLHRDFQADYVSTTGETRTVDLADGSKVQLDSDSAIAVNYTAEGRAVTLLGGRAFFQVTPDRQRPFTVRADDVAVIVTGTAFDVRLAKTDVRVAVESGEVHVDYGQAATAILSPGDRLRLDRSKGMAAIDHVPSPRIAPWTRGRLMVESATVAHVVEELGRYRVGTIILADDALANRSVTGVFDLNDPVRALRAVVEPHAGKVREFTPWLLVITGS